MAQAPVTRAQAQKRPYEDSTCAPNAVQFAKRAGIDTHACRLVLVSENCESAEWPTKVDDAMCLRCLQPFSGVPWPRVIGYCTKQKVYRCFGYLCRARCAKSDVRERSRHGASNGYHHTEESWLECVARDYYGVNLADVVPAPPLAYLPTLYGKHVRDGAANPLQAAVDEYRDNTPQCSVVAQLPFVRTTFFMEMAHASQAEEDRRAQNSQRIQQPAVTLENSNGGRLIEAQKQAQKQVLRRKSAQPASQSSIRAAAAAASAAASASASSPAAGACVKAGAHAPSPQPPPPSTIESMLGITRRAAGGNARKVG